MNNLEKYLLSTSDDDLDIESFLLEDNLNLVADYEGMSSFLYSNDNQRIVADFILAANKTIQYLKEHRDHVQNFSPDFFHIFKTFAKESLVISPETFAKYFKCVYSISLDKDELKCNSKIVNSIDSLRNLNSSDEDIRHSFKKLCNLQTITYKDLWPNINEFELTNNDGHYKCLTGFVSSNKTSLNDILQFFSYIELDKEYNDIPLETRFVFPRALSNSEINEGNTIVVINPSFFFIKKWISNRHQIKGKKILFFITDKDDAQLLNTKLMFNSLFHFYSIDELDEIIDNPKLIPSLSVVFANHLNSGIDYSKVVGTLLSHISDKHRLMLFAPDKNIHKDSLLHDLLKDQEIKRIELLPRNIENATSPQRKMLLYIDYGYTTKSNTIEVKNYGLLKNNCRLLSGNPLVLNLDKCLFVNSPEEIRNKFYEIDKESQKKTGNKRRPALRYLVSKEISIEYTLSGSGIKEDPYRGSAYFLYPPIAGKSSRIENCFAEFKTLSEDKTFNWIENNFLYLIKKNKKGECIDIRKTVSEIYAKHYEGRAISLKSFIYIHPELEAILPKYYLDVVKEINDTYIADIPLNQINYDTLLSFIKIDFKGYSCSENQLLSLFNTIFNAAIEHKNCLNNPARKILNESRREASGLDDVKSALTQKFFYNFEISKVHKEATTYFEKRTNIGLGIALMLRLYLGDEGNIISALKWKDVFLDQEVPYVYIQRQVSNDGTTYLPFSYGHLVRKKPIVEELRKVLEAEKTRQLSEIANGNEEYLNECTVICGTDCVIAGISQIYSPAKLSQSIRKILKKMKIDQDLIYVPTDGGGTIETNLSYYTGDIFKSNYWHYLVKNNPDIKSGELFYLLGIKDQFDTDSNHYIDYSNDYSQKKLLKLQPTYSEVSKK